MMKKIQPKKKQSVKDFPGDLLRVKFLEDEIDYAKSQLQEHDTGHIHTAINWLDHRVRTLKGIYDR